MASSENRWRDQVAGQVVVVTGGGGVIGRAICEAFARAGALVAVADIADDPRESAVTSIQQAGGRAVSV